METFIEQAISRCPFLSGVSESEGVHVARKLAERPLHYSGKAQAQGPIFEEAYSLDSVFSAVHGSKGIFPITFDGSRNGGRYAYSAHPRECLGEDASAKPSCQPHSVEERGITCPHGGNAACGTFASAPFATIALSAGFLGDGWPWSKAKRGKRGKRKQETQKQNHNSAPQEHHILKQALSPLTAMVISKQGHLVCPPPIVWMRTTLAKSPMCRLLRPLDLNYKLAACGVLSALANLPPGMAKEHLEKFSPGWFVAIHISVPFVAALRKAVVMPKYAMVVTIAGAVAGQMIGGKLEKRRLRHKEQQALAALRGDRCPEEVPFFCSLLKGVINPWEVEAAVQ